MTLDDVLKGIEEIERDKKARGVFPHHAQFLELQLMFGDKKQLQIRLNELVKANKIIWGESLNDKYFKINYNYGKRDLDINRECK